MENHMNEQIGQIVRNKSERTLGQIVELQVRRVRDGYRSEWSLNGGDKWNSLLTISSDPDLALLKASSGAFLAIVHQNALKRMQE
jgi:hypothetical protein